MDSGGSGHFVCNPGDLENSVTSYDVQVTVGNGESLRSVARGQLEVVLNNHEKLTLDNVHAIPGLTKNIISVGALADHYPVVFWKGLCSLLNLETGKSFVLAKKREDNLYYVASTGLDHRNESKEPLQHQIFINKKASVHTWHRRFGHVAVRRIKKSIALSEDEEICIAGEDKFCIACALNKCKKKPHLPLERPASDAPLKLIHVDLHIPSVPSLNHHKYLLVIVDDNTRFTWSIPLQKKSDVPDALIQWHRQVTNEHPRRGRATRRVVMVRSDQGTEFKNEALESYLASQGIKVESSVPYEPQQNGVVERRIGILKEMALTMLNGARLPQELWHFAFEAATILLNRLHSALISGIPYQKYHGSESKLHLNRIRVFGCRTFVKLPAELARMHGGQVFEGVFLGYPQGVKGYRVLIPDIKRMLIMYNVKFDEDTHPAVHKDVWTSLRLTKVTDTPIVYKFTNGSWRSPWNDVGSDLQSPIMDLDMEDVIVCPPNTPAEWDTSDPASENVRMVPDVLIEQVDVAQEAPATSEIADPHQSDDRQDEIVQRNQDSDPRASSSTTGDVDSMVVKDKKQLEYTEELSESEQVLQNVEQNQSVLDHPSEDPASLSRE